MSGRCQRVTLLFAFGSIVIAASVLSGQSAGTDCSYLVAGRSYANTFGGFINAQQYLNVNLGPEGQWVLLPSAGAGIMTFRADGTVTNTETLMAGQFIGGKMTLNGSYTLAWDSSKIPIMCAGRVRLPGEVNGMSFEDDFQMTVTSDGHRVELIHTNAGLIVATATRPAEVKGCSNATIGGKYTYSTKGWGLGALVGVTDSKQLLAGYVAASMSGTLQFFPYRAAPDDFIDAPLGASAVLGWDTLNIGGALSASMPVLIYRKMLGWYKVDPTDCTGTLLLRDDTGVDPEFKIDFYIGKDGNLVYAVDANVIDGPMGPIPGFVMPIPLERVTSRAQNRQ